MTHEDKIGYSCGTDWRHELGNIQVTVFSSVEELKRDHADVEGCGVAELKISFVRWVIEPDKEVSERNMISPDRLDAVIAEQAREKIKSLEKWIEVLEGRAKDDR